MTSSGKQTRRLALVKTLNSRINRLLVYSSSFTVLSYWFVITFSWFYWRVRYWTTQKVELDRHGGGLARRQTGSLVPAEKAVPDYYLVAEEEKALPAVTFVLGG